MFIVRVRARGRELRAWYLHWQAVFHRTARKVGDAHASGNPWRSTDRCLLKKSTLFPVFFLMWLGNGARAYRGYTNRQTVLTVDVVQSKQSENARKKAKAFL